MVGHSSVNLGMQQILIGALKTAYKAVCKVCGNMRIVGEKCM